MTDIPTITFYNKIFLQQEELYEKKGHCFS